MASTNCWASASPARVSRWTRRGTLMSSGSSKRLSTANPIQPANSGNGDVFVTKINAAGSALVFSIQRIWAVAPTLIMAWGLRLTRPATFILRGQPSQATFPPLIPFNPPRAAPTMPLWQRSIPPARHSSIRLISAAAAAIAPMESRWTPPATYTLLGSLLLPTFRQLVPFKPLPVAPAMRL